MTLRSAHPSLWSRFLKSLPAAIAIALALSFATAAPRPASGSKTQGQKVSEIGAQPPAVLSKPAATPKPDTDLDEESAEEREREEGFEGDADIPPFVRGTVDKEEYLQARGSWVASMRGFDTAKTDSRAKALQQMERQERSLGLSGPGASTSAALNAFVDWRYVGPDPIPNGQTTAVSSPVSGRVSAIAVDPTDANVVWVGAAGGGVFRSLDGGTSWTAVLDSALVMATGAIAVAPSDPTIVYVGTGEAGGSSDSFIGVGIYRITNAKSGTPVVEGPFNLDGTATNVFNGRSVSKILVHPTDPATIFAATASGVGGNPGAQTGFVFPNRGFWRSTNATSASPVFAKLPVATAPGNFPFYDAVMEPGNPDNILVTINAAGADGGVWRTTNANAADPNTVVFTRTLALASVRAELAINKVGATVTVVVASGENTPIGSRCTAQVQGGVRISTDGGVTWSAAPLQSAGGFCNAQCFYDIFVALDPNDANKIYLGGAADSGSANPCRASISQVSSDGGATFTRNSNALHADSHAVAIAPTNTSIVYTGNDGGIFKSTDGGATWVSLNNFTFSATQFQSIAVHPRHPKFTIGGTQDNGTHRMDGAAAWNRVDFGDGGYALIDQSAYGTADMTMYHTYFNQTNNIIGFARVLPGETPQDNGWTFLGFGGVPNGIVNQNVIFYAPIALGPGTPNTLYFAGDKLYRSTDRGTTMTQVSQFLGAFAITIAVSPQDDNYRLVGTSNGKIFGTTTGGNPLTDLVPVSLIAPAAARNVNRVVFDPNDKNVAYFTYGGYGLAAGAHVFKNSNLSATPTAWVASGSGIPDVPVNSIVVDPQDSNRLYVATDIGVYGSTDAGATWNPVGAGLPRVAVFDLAIQNQSRTLRIATHGRGMWELTIPGTVIPVGMLDLVSSSTTILGGNGNAYLESGEDAALSVTLSNAVGVSATLSAMSATLTTATPGVTILNGTASYGDLAPGASGANTAPFTFHVDSTALCGEMITFTVTVNYTGDSASPRVFTVKVPTGQSGAVVDTAYTGAPVAIPDSPAPAVTATQVVSGIMAAAAKVTFSIDGTVCDTTPASTTVGLDHTFVGDLAISLTSPSGTTVRLTAVGGNAGVNFCNTVFDDAAATAWIDATSASAPFTGSFRPVDPLSAFIGEDPNGTWTVTLRDGGGGDVGTLRAFTVHVTEASCATPYPSVVTGAASGVGEGSATLAASINPNGLSTTAFFDYGPTNAYGSQIAATPAPGSGTAFVGVTATPTGLECGSTYHYRAGATSSAGTTNGADATFTTSACPQLVISDVSIQEGVSGSANAVFTVGLSPASTETVTVSALASNLTASAGTDYAASGPTVLTFTPGATTRTFSVPVFGDNVVEPNETFQVTLSSPSHAAILDGTGIGTIVNDDGSTISVTDASVAEGTAGPANSLSFTVVLSATSTSTITVDYATANGTATAGSDYTATSGTLSFPPGVASKVVTVPVTPDATIESDETLFLNLSNATNATVFDAQGLGTIQADDGLLVSIADKTTNEGNVGFTPVNFTVSLSSPAPGAVSVNWATADGTATAPLDYTAASGTVNFAIGESSKTVTVQVVGETAQETHETFFINLSSPTGAAIGDGQAKGIILNTDGSTDKSRLMFHNFVTNRLYRWHMKNGNQLDTYNWVTPWATDAGWTVGAVADFDRDGQLDYLWHNSSTGQMLYWYIDGDNLKGFRFLPFTAAAPWTVGTTFDANNDGAPDLAFFNPTNGTIRVILMDNATLLGQHDITTLVPASQKLVAAADTNNDGDDELLLYNSSTGQLQSWNVTGPTLSGTATYANTQATSPAFNLVSTKTDFNNDGLADLLWHNPTPTGTFSVWFMNGMTRLGTGTFTPYSNTDPVWRIVGSANVW
ncbi:MAG: proprotein convertase P-domain-containing protein [Vicinamibacteria bacterium]|nr:proprotein convertase P-domain-containing protein [Vicinamibacteria bacterium]